MLSKLLDDEDEVVDDHFLVESFTEVVEDGFSEFVSDPWIGNDVDEVTGKEDRIEG
jgi:hypothetical protein